MPSRFVESSCQCILHGPGSDLRPRHGRSRLRYVALVRARGIRDLSSGGRLEGRVCVSLQHASHVSYQRRRSCDRGSCDVLATPSALYLGMTALTCVLPD
ncbi:hypothetical protein IG631_15683 [Alternaria alternata]|nr:hypothetical protein IG631_15683 [Alternaria alternata]